MADARRILCHMSEMPDIAGGVIPEWTLGWRMQRALGHAHLTTEEMADDLGVSRSTVSRWVNDKGPVRVIYLKQWALRTGVPLAWLLDGSTGSPMNARYWGEGMDELEAAA
jgi:transcriptional regulator with XRE-family HTH domain